MKKRYYILLMAFTLSISGCTTNKNEPTTPNTTIEQQLNSNEMDDELSEFEEEMESPEIHDPLGGYNRIMTSFNDTVMVYVVIPLSNGYKAVIPLGVRQSVSNFFNNAAFPVRFANNLLQGKIENTTEETQRFLLNTTLGMAGLFDVAKDQFEIKPHKEDFGQTLGYWGVDAGPHIVLPFLGPSNLRDLVGIFPDSYANPLEYYEQRDHYNIFANSIDALGAKAFSKVNETSLSGNAYEKIKADAVDLYPFLRDMYEQYREKQIQE